MWATAMDLEEELLTDTSLCFRLRPELAGGACSCSDRGLLLEGRVRGRSGFFFFLTGVRGSGSVEEGGEEPLEEEERLDRYSCTRASPKSNTVEAEASLWMRLTGLAAAGAAGWVEEVAEELELKELEVEEKLRELSLERFLFFLR